MRGCYCVRNHADGTGTVALDWFETSDGRDYHSSDTFMRTEIETARKIVSLLNGRLPGRVIGVPVELDWSGQDDSG